MEEGHVTQSDIITSGSAADAAFSVVAVDPIWFAANKEHMQKDLSGVDMSKIWGEQTADVVVLGNSGTGRASGLGKTESRVAVVRFSGGISKHGWAGTVELNRVLKLLAEEKSISGVRLVIDSGGGQMAGVRDVYETIRDYPKPIEAVVSSTLASAAYYMVSAADNIFALQPTDSIGSIGVMTKIRDYSKDLERLGIAEYVQYATRSKDKNEEIRELTDSKGAKAEKLIQYLDVLNEQFITDVIAGRGDRLKTDKEDPFTGKLYFTAQAEEIGLIDGILSSIDNYDSMEILIKSYYENQTQTPMASLKDKIMALFDDNTPENAPSETTATAEELTTQVAGLTTERDNAVASLTSAQATISSLTAERDEWKAKADAFGSQPGDTPTIVPKAKDETPTEGTEAKTLEQILAELPSEQRAAELGFN